MMCLFSNDMKSKLEQSLNNDSSFDVVILHVGSNDSKMRKSRNMLNDILILKQYVENKFSAKVVISSLIGRIDDGNANLMIRQFNDKLFQLKVQTVDNSNITPKYLGKKGLHLTSPYGTSRLEKKILNFVRNL